MAERIDVPVLVVGAGPVGMSAALLLARTLVVVGLFVLPVTYFVYRLFEVYLNTP